MGTAFDPPDRLLPSLPRKPGFPKEFTNRAAVRRSRHGTSHISLEELQEVDDLDALARAAKSVG